MAYFNKRYHPPGTPPGTLTEHKTESKIPLTIHLIDYRGDELIEKELATAEECHEFLHRDSITWIHIQGTNDLETLNDLGKLFNLHPLALEDISNAGQRPKVEEYSDQLFIIMGLPVIENKNIRSEQISFFLGENYVISFHESQTDPFKPMRARIRNKAGKIRNRPADFLLYCLVDIVIDNCFPLFETLGMSIETLEMELLQSPTKNTLSEIHHIKRELLILRRVLWPQRDILTRIMMNSLLSGKTISFIFAIVMTTRYS
jgi:magnesium transporter